MHDEPIDEGPGTDEHPDGGNVGNRFGQLVKGRGELLNDFGKVDDDEVRGRWLTAWPALGAELILELSEERVRDSNLATFRSRGFSVEQAMLLCDASTLRLNLCSELWIKIIQGGQLSASNETRSIVGTHQFHFRCGPNSSLGHARQLVVRPGTLSLA